MRQQADPAHTRHLPLLTSAGKRVPVHASVESAHEWLHGDSRLDAAHSDEGQADSLTHGPVSLPQSLLPRQDRPTHCKPRQLVGVDWNPTTQQWSNRPDNSDPKILQIMELNFAPTLMAMTQLPISMTNTGTSSQRYSEPANGKARSRYTRF
eukprot:scaffold258724_cov25-Prasinocladus_malaysianus.AAC.2